MMERLAALVFSALVALAACAGPHGPAPVERPSRLLVSAFDADPAIVELDTSVRRGAAGTGAAGDVARADDIAAAQETLTATLLYRFQDMGLTAQRLTQADPPGDKDFVVSGKLTRISEGDRTERASGGGHPVVEGRMTVARHEPKGDPTIVAAFEGNSATAAPPGLPGASAAAAAALATGGERARQLLRAGVTAEARRLGNIFADQTRAAFDQRGLLPPPTGVQSSISNPAGSHT
jgi:hypothetical protein